MQEKTIEALIDWNLCSDQLYDREDQLQALTAAYKRRNHTSTPELVLITGTSGSGKSALARSIKTRVEDDWGFFVAGKFDEIQTPHAAFIAAVEELVKQICLRGDVVVESVREAILEAMGSDMETLLDAIPKLSELVEGKTSVRREDESCSSTTSDFSVGVGTDHHAHFNSVFCRFLRAVGSTQHSLVLLLDDLQWADTSSLEILSSLLNPLLQDSMEGMMIVSTCRGNEVSCDDNLSVMLRRIEDIGTIITEIKVDNLTAAALSEMVSNVLELPIAECQPLAEIVHGHTGGNAFFAKQYIKSILEEGIVTKDPVTNKFVWDEPSLLLALPSASYPNSQQDDLIIQLLARKMQQLPTIVVETLKVIACLGTNFTEDILFRTGSVVSSQILLALEVAVQRGFIAYDVNMGVGHFVHDKFREAAYSLILAEERALFHLRIGRNLRRQWPTTVVKANIILIVDQIKYGLDYVQDVDERDDFARLFLRASREAAKASAFEAALVYADLGIGLLSSRHWRDQYDLSLDLYSTGAELAYCTGKRDKLDAWAKEVVDNARSIGDKTRVMMTQIVSFGSRGNIREGVNLCLEVLQTLKEPYPRRCGKARILLEFYKTKRALGNRTEEDILGLPEISNLRAVASMQIIYLLFPLLAIRDLDLTPLPAFRLINLTLEYGLSPIGKPRKLNVMSGVFAKEAVADKQVTYIGESGDRFHPIFRHTSKNGGFRGFLPLWKSSKYDH